MSSSGALLANSLSTEEISVCHINIRSLRGKTVELSDLLDSLGGPMVVTLSEIWCTDEEVSLLRLESYNLAAAFCRSSLTRGGVAIYVRRDIEYSIRRSACPRFEKHFEYVLCNVVVSSKSFLVGCFYRTPDSDIDIFLDSLNALLSDVMRVGTESFFAGDFNVKFHIADNKPACRLVNLFTCFGLHKCITEFTRIQGDSRATLDNIFCTADGDGLRSQVVPADLSDHFMPLVVYNFVAHDKTESVFRRLFFKRDNINVFKNELSKIDWSPLLLENSLDDKFAFFFDAFSGVVDFSFPMEKSNKRRGSQNKAWLSSDIVKQGRFLRDLFRSCKYTNDPELWARYRVLKKSHVGKVREAKNRNFNTLFLNSNNKMKTAWAIIKDRTSGDSKRRFPDLFIDDFGRTASNLNDAAQLFNDYFINSVKDLTNLTSATKKLRGDFNSRSLFLSPLTAPDTREIILSVSRKNSAGFDGIPCSLLKNVVGYISEPLTMLVNASFVEGTFPTILKLAVVQPVLKKGDTDRVSNYRCIALLSVFSKIFEKAFYERLLKFLESSDFFVGEQYGFRRGLSTQHAILSLYRRILIGFDRGEQTACLFFDLKKAFDVVNHRLLFEKLSMCGVRGTALSWLKSYLTGRTQSVVLKSAGQQFSSGIGVVTSGVPQGSLLGPLLFLVFINDIVPQFESQYISLFADDTVVASSSHDFGELSTQARSSTANMSAYCSDNGLVLNECKTELVVFSLRDLNKSLLVRLSNETIPESVSTKFLGVYFDKHLTWSAQLEHVLRRLAVHCYVIWQLRNKLTFDLLKLYYFAHVQSCLTYGVQCWGNAPRSDEVLILQKKILRTMTSKPRRYSCRGLFREHNILTLPSLFILSSVRYVVSDRSEFSLSRDGGVGYNLRLNYDMTIPQHRLTFVANSPLILPVKLYNKLPASLRTLGKAKLVNSVKMLLLRHSFYSVAEYLNCAEFD